MPPLSKDIQGLMDSWPGPQTPEHTMPVRFAMMAALKHNAAVLESKLAAANAQLERVRYALRGTPNVSEALEALAALPDAPSPAPAPEQADAAERVGFPHLADALRQVSACKEHGVLYHGEWAHPKPPAGTLEAIPLSEQVRGYARQLNGSRPIYQIQNALYAIAESLAAQPPPVAQRAEPLQLEALRELAVEMRKANGGGKRGRPDYSCLIPSSDVMRWEVTVRMALKLNETQQPPPVEPAARSEGPWEVQRAIAAFMAADVIAINADTRDIKLRFNSEEELKDVVRYMMGAELERAQAGGK